MISSGTQIDSATFEAVAADGGRRVVLLFRWGADPHRYGLPVDLSGDREYLHGDPVGSWEEWLETFDINLLEDLGTGRVENSKRVRRAEWIELDDTRRWPFDPGYDTPSWDAVGLSQRPSPLTLDGLTVSAGDLESGRVLAAVAAIPDPGPGDEVALAVAHRTGSDSADLEVRCRVGAEDHLRADVLHLASHVAATEGVTRLTTDENAVGANLVGFQPDAQGRLVTDTSFLNEDVDAAIARFGDEEPHEPGPGPDARCVG